MSKWTFVALCALLSVTILLAGCGSEVAPVPTVKSVTHIVRTPTPVPATAEEAIRQLIYAECEAVVQQDVDRLQGIWASDGVVTDANHTPDNAADDVTWKSWDAIRDRYVNIVFPSSPTFCEHPNTQVAVTGVSATATTGIKIGTTNCADCNKWTFKKAGDAWKISTLTYDLDSAK